MFADPETWVALTWLIVVALLVRPVGKAVVASLDARRDRIREQLAEAERLRDEAQEALAYYQKKQRDALKEAEAIIAQAKSEAERLTRQAAANLDELMRRRESQAVERIAQAEAEAMHQVRNQAVDIAITAARRVIAQSLSADSATALIDSAIKDLPARLDH